MRKLGFKLRKTSLVRALVPSLVGAALIVAAALPAAAAWEPNKPVEFVVPAGTGGGAKNLADTNKQLQVALQPAANKVSPVTAGREIDFTDERGCVRSCLIESGALLPR